MTSMNHRAGLDRSQTLLFPERLEDYIAAQNPVRFLDAFVGSLDLAERMKRQPEKFKLRKTLAEHPFGTIKRWFGYTHFLLKGLVKVRCEWSLTTLAYNLKRESNPVI